MAPIIDEVLVDLFTLFDGEIRQEFASVRRKVENGNRPRNI